MLIDCFWRYSETDFTIAWNKLSAKSAISGMLF